MTPGSTPMLELAVRIALLAGTGTAALMTALRADPAQITAMIRQALLTVASRAAQPPGRLVIVVDQFEQIFTQCADERERRAFIGALSAAARTTGTEPPQAMVVLAVRADFETRCSEYAELADAVQNRYLVPSMTPSGLRQAIVAPVQAAGSRIDAGLVEILLRDAAEPSGTAVALPLVSYALDQTWRGRSGEDLTVDDYIRVGGISSAIAASADSCYDGLTPSQQAMARLLFMRLTALNARGEPAAHPVSRAELAESMPAGDAEDLSAVIGAFTDQRLLTLGDGMIIISHEVLLSAWPRLRAWLSGSQAGLIIRTRLIESATDWASSGRDPAYLYRGSLLDSAWAASARIDANQLPLSRRERDFLDASMRARRRSVRRRRMIIALLILVIIVLVAQNIVILLSR